MSCGGAVFERVGCFLNTKKHFKTPLYTPEIILFYLRQSLRMLKLDAEDKTNLLQFSCLL